jgi:hypothetical protein
MLKPSVFRIAAGGRTAIGALAFMLLGSGASVAPQAQDRPYWDQQDTYGDRRAAQPRPRRDDAYRPPEGSGPPGGFGSEPAPYGRSEGGRQSYDSAPSYGGQRDYAYDRPLAYGGPPAYGGNQPPGPRESWQQPAQPPNDAYSPSYGQQGQYQQGQYQGQYPSQGGWREPPPAPREGGNYGYGEPYAPPPAYDGPRGRDHTGPGYNEYGEPPRRTGGTYSQNEVIDSGHRFFGSVSQSLARAVESVFKSQGRPNGYILGEDAGGAFLAGLRYGEGTLYTKDAGNHKVFWQGPSLGYDFGGEGSKTMVLVYNLRDPSEIYTRFGGVQGSAYLIGGVGVQFQKHEHVTLAVIRSGVGLRLGANVGYLKYTPRPTWNPF